jgi:hypothetical protein
MDCRGLIRSLIDVIDPYQDLTDIFLAPGMQLAAVTRACVPSPGILVRLYSEQA